MKKEAVAEMTASTPEVVDDFDEAVGSHEAAALMGVHFTMPARWARAGKIVGKPVGSLGSGKRQTRLYSRNSCEQNWLKYERELEANRGRTRKRPRASVANRIAVLKFLSNPDRRRIAYHDAISAADAAVAMGDVHWTYATRMVAQGKVTGRKLWCNRTTRPRSSDDRVYVISRESCRDNYVSALETKSPGRKRKRVRKAATDVNAGATNRKEYVYFYEESHQSRVKIGTTRNAAEARVRQSQTGNSRKLVLLLRLDGGVDLEKKLHKRFKEFRVPDGGTEWFFKTEKLAAYIDRELAKQKAAE